jgi:hypothetical protein
MSGLKEAGWWLCFPNAISETCLAAFKAVVAGSNMQVVMEDLLEGKGDVVVQDLRQFAEWFHVRPSTCDAFVSLFD